MNLPPFETYPILADKHVILHQLRESDLEALMEICYYNRKKANSIAEAKEKMYQILKDYEAGQSIHWVITDAVLHQTLGTCGFYRGFRDRSAELGYSLLPEFRGHGWMHLALQNVIRFGFETMQLDCIFAITAEDNIKSRNVLEKLGFKLAANRKDEDVVYELRKK